MPAMENPTRPPPPPTRTPHSSALQTPPELATAIAALDSFMTPPDNFHDGSPRKPLRHSLPPEKLTEVGLTRETWKLEVLQTQTATTLA
jgi:hypothetical protein